MSCRKESLNPDQGEITLLFGQYFGLCGGEQCVEIFKFENDLLYEDTLDIYPSRDIYMGAYIPLDHTVFEEVESVRDEIPSYLLQRPDTTFGIPDAYDQGGLYLAYLQGQQEYYWHLDRDENNIPDELRSYQRQLRDLIDSLAN